MVRAVVLISLVSLVACKGKPQHRPPPENVATGSNTASVGSGADRAAPDISLPKGPGTPPPRGASYPTPTQLDKAAELTFPGFVVDQRTVRADVFVVKHTTEDHPKISTTVRIVPCGTSTGSGGEPENECTPIDLAKFKEKGDRLKRFLAPMLRADPNTEFEVGETELRGEKMIYTYQVGYVHNGESGAYTDTYVLYWNDGVTYYWVMAAYTDDPADKENLKKMVPKSDVENTAKAFMDVFTHAIRQ